MARVLLEPFEDAAPQVSVDMRVTNCESFEQEAHSLTQVLLVQQKERLHQHGVQDLPERFDFANRLRCHVCNEPVDEFVQLSGAALRSSCACNARFMSRQRA